MVEINEDTGLPDRLYVVVIDSNGDWQTVPDSAFIEGKPSSEKWEQVGEEETTINGQRAVAKGYERVRVNGEEAAGYPVRMTLVEPVDDSQGEVWLERSRTVKTPSDESGQYVEIVYELLRDNLGDYTGLDPSSRETMTMFDTVPGEAKYEEKSREEVEETITDPDSNAELVYKQVTRITMECKHDGRTSFSDVDSPPTMVLEFKGPDEIN